MTVEISDNTHRLLRQLAMMQNVTPDEVAERILSAFCNDVVMTAARKLQEDLSDYIRHSS